jgi:hypothetical protein
LAFLPRLIPTVIPGFFPRKSSVWKKAVLPIFSVFCVHNAKCSGIFLRLTTLAASVITDFKIFDMYTSKKYQHYCWKLVAKEMKRVNVNISP